MMSIHLDRLLMATSDGDDKSVIESIGYLVLQHPEK